MLLPNRGLRRNRWPICDLDTGNSADRPYVCTIVEPRDWLPRRGGLSTASRGGGWFRAGADRVSPLGPGLNSTRTRCVLAYLSPLSASKGLIPRGIADSVTVR